MKKEAHKPSSPDILTTKSMQIISKYFPELTSRQQEQFEMLGELYKRWNNEINVISRKDISNLYLHHILHSLSIAKAVKFKSSTTIMDVGTGGGLPGLPLAIYFPDSHFYLVDSIGKKIKVVNNIIQELQLKNAAAEQRRAEEVNAKFDFITSRAVTNLPELYSWIKGKIKGKSINDIPNGMLSLKGGDVSEEMKPFKKGYTIYNIQDYFEEEYFKDKKIIRLS